MIQTALNIAPALAHEECGIAQANPPITGLTCDGSVRRLPAQVVPIEGPWLIRQPLLSPRPVRPSRKKPEIKGGVVGIPWLMLNSRAYIDLPASARAAFPYFLAKPHVNYADGRMFSKTFAFSYTEGKSIGFAFSTFNIVIRRLVLHGFVDPVVRGGLRGEQKATSTFCVSRRWEKYGQPDFMRVNYDKKKRQARKPATPVSVNADSQASGDAINENDCVYNNMSHDPSVSGECYRSATVN